VNPLLRVSSVYLATRTTSQSRHSISRLQFLTLLTSDRASWRLHPLTLVHRALAAIQHCDNTITALVLQVKWSALTRILALQNVDGSI
jgi:hypothetical protein